MSYMSHTKCVIQTLTDVEAQVCFCWVNIIDLSLYFEAPVQSKIISINYGGFHILDHADEVDTSLMR